MAEQQELREYGQGDTVRLTVEVRDENGVLSAGATGFWEENDEDHSDHNRAQLNHSLDLSGWPEEETTHAEFVLDGAVEQQVPGVYVCYVVVAENAYGALTRHELDPPMRFRIVEHPGDVREGPEILSVSEFW